MFKIFKELFIAVAFVLFLSSCGSVVSGKQNLSKVFFVGGGMPLTLNAAVDNDMIVLWVTPDSEVQGAYCLITTQGIVTSSYKKGGLSMDQLREAFAYGNYGLHVTVGLLPGVMSAIGYFSEDESGGVVVANAVGIFTNVVVESVIRTRRVQAALDVDKAAHVTPKQMKKFLKKIKETEPEYPHACSSITQTLKNAAHTVKDVVKKAVD